MTWCWCGMVEWESEFPFHVTSRLSYLNWTFASLKHCSPRTSSIPDLLPKRVADVQVENKWGPTNNNGTALIWLLSWSSLDVLHPTNHPSSTLSLIFVTLLDYYTLQVCVHGVSATRTHTQYAVHEHLREPSNRQPPTQDKNLPVLEHTSMSDQ